MNSKTVKQRSSVCLSLGAVGKGKTWTIFCNTVKLGGEKLKGEIDDGSYGKKRDKTKSLMLP